MAINVNPLQVGGLTALASNRVPNLNLKTYGLDLGAPMQGTAQGLIQQAAYNQQNQLAARQMAAQIMMKNSELQNQASIAHNNNLVSLANNQNTTQSQQLIAAGNQQLEAQKNQITQAYNTGKISVDQASNALKAVELQQAQLNNQQKNQIAQQNANTDQFAKEFQARMALNTQQLNMRGAAGAMMLMALNQGGPDAVKALMPTLEKEGIMTSNEASTLANIKDPAQLKTILAGDLFMSASAKDGKGSGLTNMLPGSQALFGNMPLSNKTSDAAAKQIIDANRSIADLSNNLVNFNPDLFTYQGQAENLYGEMLGKAPQFIQSIAPGAKNAKDFAASMASYKSNTLQGMMDTLSQQTGVRFNKMTLDTLEPEVPLPGKDSPDQAFAETVTLIQRMQRGADYAIELAKKGIPLDSKENKEKVFEYVKNLHPPGTLPYKASDGSTHNLNYSDIQALSQHNHQSLDDTIKYVMQHGY